MTPRQEVGAAARAMVAEAYGVPVDKVTITLNI
jgi:hypothetical protein